MDIATLFKNAQALENPVLQNKDYLESIKDLLREILEEAKSIKCLDSYDVLPYQYFSEETACRFSISGPYSKVRYTARNDKGSRGDLNLYVRVIGDNKFNIKLKFVGRLPVLEGNKTLSYYKGATFDGFDDESFTPFCQEFVNLLVSLPKQMETSFQRAQDKIRRKGLDSNPG